MCGIFGAIDIDGFFTHSDYRRFVGLTDLVSYRGPDSAGHMALEVKKAGEFISERWDVFLGHRRLSIIDLTDAGRQPMTDGQGLWLIFNGEIFNFIELREELEQLGDTFTTHTDGEVILRTYSRYGIDGFSRFNGMWAFAIVDLPRRCVVLSRDRFAIKPLYFTRQGARLYFGSEIKQLLPLLPSQILNRDVMLAFLSQHLLDHTNDTFFHGIRKVPPKTALVISLDNGDVTSKRYWDYSPEPIDDFDQAIERFRALLDDSVRLRLRSDVEVGCLLSGGLDSSSIATICRGLGAFNVETFSVVSQDERYSEERYIDLMSAKTRIRNHKLLFSVADTLNNLGAVLTHSDEPVASFSVVAQYNIFRLIKRESNVKVLLSGQGADEVLLGYLKFFFLYVKEMVSKGKLATAAIELFASLVRGTMVRQFRLSNAKRYVPWLSGKPYGGALNLGSTYTPVQTWQFRSLRDRQIADVDHYSVPALTHYEDRNSMAHSLEVRHPFLDHRIVNYLVSLPTAYKIKHGWTKYLLRRSLTDLPSPIRWRRDKQGFTVEEAKWARGELQPAIRAAFRNSCLAQIGILSDRKFLNYYEKFLAGNSVFFLDICRAFIAEMWTRSISSGDGPQSREAIEDLVLMPQPSSSKA